MLEYLVYFLRWNMRLWYPVLRILGQVTGQQDRVETWLKVTEENIQNTLDALGDK